MTDIPLKYYFLFISTPKIFASRRRRAFGELITTIFIVTLLLFQYMTLGWLLLIIFR